MSNHKSDERIGLLAGLLTTTSFIPQVIAVWKNRPNPAEIISLATFSIFCVGVVLWLWYGARIKNRVLIGFNSITLFLGLMIMAYKLIYG